jgi:hypothetical protein
MVSIAAFFIAQLLGMEMGDIGGLHVGRFIPHTAKNATKKWQ